MSFESLLADPSLLVYHPLQDNAASTVISNPAAGGSDGELLGGSTTAARSVDDGPTEWLPRSIHLSYSPHHVRIGSPSPESIDAFTVLFRVRPDSVSGARDFAGRWDSYTATPTANNQRFLIRTNGAQSQFFVRRATASTTASATGPNLAAGVWHNIAAVATGSVLRIGVNGVFGSDVSLSGPYLPSPSMDWFIGAAHSGSSSGRYADFAIFTRALSTAEIADWFAGPTGSVPENLSPPTLTIYSTSFTGSVGSWDAMGAGPLTYEWELRDSGDNVVDSGSGTTISGTGSFSGQYYLWVEATNSVGSEEAASSLVEVVEDEPAEGSGVAAVTISTTGVGYRQSSGLGEASLAVTVAGEGSSGSGGSGSAACVVGVAGVGHAERSGSGSDSLLVAASGSGYRQSSGFGELDAVVSTAGEGYASTGSYGETLLLASASGQGYVIRSGSGAAAMAIETAGAGQSAEPSTAGVFALKTSSGYFFIQTGNQ